MFGVGEWVCFDVFVMYEEIFGIDVDEMIFFVEFFY